MVYHSPYLSDNKVVEGVGLRQDEVLLDVHKLIGSHGSQLGKVWKLVSFSNKSICRHKFIDSFPKGRDVIYTPIFDDFVHSSLL